MNVLGYAIGEIHAEAAMTSDIVLPHDLPFDKLNDYVEIERRSMDIYRGMNRKYTPIQYDTVTGGTICGGRYVFDTWENVQDYFRWTQEELEFEPGIKFWDRAMFQQVDKHIWKVIGAHDFTHVDTHGVNRFERWHYGADPAVVKEALTLLWPQLREQARRAGLGSVWLLDQPDERQIAIMTSNATAHDDNDVPSAQHAVAQLANMPSLGALLPAHLGLRAAFNRTSMVFSTWLPLSRQQRGAPAINPMSPPLPLPAVPTQEV